MRPTGSEREEMLELAARAGKGSDASVLVPRDIRTGMRY